MFFNAQSYSISELDINTNTGAVTVKGPITITAQTAGEIAGFAYDSTLPGWRLLTATPIGPPAGAPVGVEILEAPPPDE